MINELPHGVSTPCVGDEVLIRGIVKAYQPGVGVLVSLVSKTDVYHGWVRLDRVADVVLPDTPPEPPDGTWLAGTYPGGVNIRVFVRNDAEGHNDPERRHHRHWWDVTDERWVDWPTAVKHGADLTRVLTFDSLPADKSPCPVPDTTAQTRDPLPDGAPTECAVGVCPVCGSHDVTVTSADALPFTRSVEPGTDGRHIVHLHHGWCPVFTRETPAVVAEPETDRD